MYLKGFFTHLAEKYSNRPHQNGVCEEHYAQNVRRRGTICTHAIACPRWVFMADGIEP